MRSAIPSLLIILLSFSCSKKEDDPNLTNTQKLTNQTWKLTKVGFAGISAPPDACTGDDVYTFATGGAYTQDEGASKCNPGNPQQTTGTWEFTNNETKIKVSYGFVVLEKEILELTSTTLRVKYTVIFDLEETYSH